MTKPNENTTKVRNRCLRLAAKPSDEVYALIKHIKHHDHKVQLVMRAHALTLLTAKTLAGLDPGSAPLAPDETTLSAAYETKLKNQRKGQMLNSSLTTIGYGFTEKILLAAAIADAKKGGGNVKEEAARILEQPVADLAKNYGLNEKDVRKKQNKALEEVRGMDDDDARLLRAPARDGAAAVGEGSESGAAVGEEVHRARLQKLEMETAEMKKGAEEAKQDTFKSFGVLSKSTDAAIKLATSNKEILEEHGRKHEQQDAINKEQTAINKEQGKKIAENHQNIETLGTAVKTLKKLIASKKIDDPSGAKRNLFDSDDAETVEATDDDSAVSADDASYGGDGLSIDFEENAAGVSVAPSLLGEESDLYTSPIKATKRSALASSPKTTPDKFRTPSKTSKASPPLETAQVTAKAKTDASLVNATEAATLLEQPESAPASTGTEKAVTFDATATATTKTSLEDDGAFMACILMACIYLLAITAQLEFVLSAIEDVVASVAYPLWNELATRFIAGYNKIPLANDIVAFVCDFVGELVFGAIMLRVAFIVEPRSLVRHGRFILIFVMVVSS